MHITCVICGDLFTGTDIAESVYSTPCGHLFHHHCLLEWLGRSPSCPQCRQKTSEKKIIRIFFNLSNTTENDSSTLAFQVDSLEYKLNERDREIKLLKAERDKSIGQAKGLRQEVIEKSNNEKKLEQSIYSLRSEVTLLKKSCKAYSLVSCENEELKKEIATLRKIRDVIQGSDTEVDAALQDADAYPNLGLCIAFYKKRIKTLQHEHKNVQTELNIQKRKRIDLESMLSSAYEEIRELKQQSKAMRTIPSTYMGSMSSAKLSPIKKMKIDRVCSESDKKELFEISDDEREKQNEDPEVSYKKPSFAHTSKSISVQPKHKIQNSFRGPLKQSFSASSSGPGDDNFHPQKYAAQKLSAQSKIVKKPKKKLCASAVSAIREVQKASTATSKIDSFFDTVEMTSPPSSRRVNSDRPSTSRMDAFLDTIEITTPPSNHRRNSAFYSDIDAILDTIQLTSPHSNCQASEESNTIDLT